ncbi:hypothetical protein NDU88_004226 [Pleurodeles waltl]|uniref:Uncharacterized protein n=1 Tax=Pleurodeles waltl TaxID=8319 RepID=A0AAV7QFA9_PLEWA|nr:hypothetical protein NDU88_004226 [Pleurodeles waltl]
MSSGPASNVLSPVRCPADPRRTAVAAPGDQQDPVGSADMRGTPRQGVTARNSMLPEIPKLQTLMIPLVMPVDWSGTSQSREAQPARSTSSVREPQYHPQLPSQRGPGAQLNAGSAVCRGCEEFTVRVRQLVCLLSFPLCFDCRGPTAREQAGSARVDKDPGQHRAPTQPVKSGVVSPTPLFHCCPLRTGRSLEGESNLPTHTATRVMSPIDTALR